MAASFHGHVTGSLCLLPPPAYQSARERHIETEGREESRGREPEEFGIMKIDGGRGRERMREERRRNIEDMLETRHQEDGVMSWSHEERRGEERDRGV